ncbi:hypothetical protein BB560_006087, partial [Smittium megazygosporum]
MRGVLVIYVAFFSVKFLGSKISRSQWVSLIMILSGATIVGLSSIIFAKNQKLHISPKPDHKASSRKDMIFGLLMIVTAQFFNALHLISEEKILLNYKISPMRVIGLEGIFATLTFSLLIPISSWSLGPKYPGSIFDVGTGLDQILANPALKLSMFCATFFLALLYWFGLSITKAINATSRSTIDCCSKKYKKPTKLPAYKYILLLFNWVNEQIDDALLFPTNQ